MRHFLFACAVVLLASCAGKSDNIPFEQAKGYFLRNDVEADSVPSKITSQEQLLQLFGMATVMGEDGKPTAIDFDKSFVIPVIYPETDVETTIKVDGLVRTASKEMTLSVSTVRGEEHESYTIRPVLLLVVDNLYRDDAVILQAGE